VTPKANPFLEELLVSQTQDRPDALPCTDRQVHDHLEPIIGLGVDGLVLLQRDQAVALAFAMPLRTDRRIAREARDALLEPECEYLPQKRQTSIAHVRRRFHSDFDLCDVPLLHLTWIELREFALQDLCRDRVLLERVDGQGSGGCGFPPARRPVPPQPCRGCPMISNRRVPYVMDKLMYFLAASLQSGGWTSCAGPSARPRICPMVSTRGPALTGSMWTSPSIWRLAEGTAAPCRAAAPSRPKATSFEVPKHLRQRVAMGSAAMIRGMARSLSTEETGEGTVRLPPREVLEQRLGVLSDRLARIQGVIGIVLAAANLLEDRDHGARGNRSALRSGSRSQAAAGTRL
jgi:hypothetical protein